MPDRKLSFIGAGNMAAAIFESVANKLLYSPDRICVSNVSSEKLARFKDRVAVTTTDNKVAADFGDIIILSVKPQVYETVLAEIKSHVAGKCLVSLAPGYSTQYINALCPDAYAARVMPNTPLLIGKGTTAIAQNTGVPDEIFQEVINIFSSSGAVYILPESSMNEIISVNGSSPAYFFRIAGAMVDAAEKMGIDRETASKMTASVMEGAAAMLTASGKSADELTAQVTSKGGTTFAALSAFDELGLDKMIEEAMIRCTQRAYELGR